MDALWISLFALLPGNDIPTASLLLGLIGLTSTTGLTIRLWRARARERLSNRWPFLLSVIIGLYGYQVSTAFTAGSALAAMEDAATLVFVFFGVGLTRAWELLGLQGGGLLDLLTTSVRQAVTGTAPSPSKPTVHGRSPGLGSRVRRRAGGYLPLRQARPVTGCSQPSARSPIAKPGMDVGLQKCSSPR